MRNMFHLFFAVYFLSLALVPCGDNNDCSEASQEQATQHHHDEDHADETCTPFCVCACCATHVIFKELQATPQLEIIVSTVYTIHKEASFSSAIIPVWQPPQIV